MPRKPRKHRDKDDGPNDRKPKARELKFAPQTEKGGFATFATIKDTISTKADVIQRD